MKKVRPFRNFLAVNILPPYTKLKPEKLWIHASNVVCGVRGGLGLYELKNL